MIQTFTTQINDVVRYIYNETSKIENAQIEESIAKDTSLLDFYLDSLNLKTEMDNIKLNPSEESISKVLAFSRDYQPVH